MLLLKWLVKSWFPRGNNSHSDRNSWDHMHEFTAMDCRHIVRSVYRFFFLTLLALSVLCLAVDLEGGVAKSGYYETPFQ